MKRFFLFILVMLISAAGLSSLRYGEWPSGVGRAVLDTVFCRWFGVKSPKR